MFASRTRFKFLGLTSLIFASLACRAATRLVIPNTPTPLPTATATQTPTLTPTLLPTFTPTAVFEPACSALLAEILNGATSTVHIPSEGPNQTFEEEHSIFLISYEVTGDKISSPQIEHVPDELEDEQEDRETHKAIWEYFVSIIPEEQRDFLSGFSIFTDGKGNHLAAVSQTFSDPEQWSLHVDILDAESYYDLTYTLIHEQGHLLTLNAEQVSPSKAIFKFPENETVYEQEVSACPQYFTSEGCSKPESYMNQFFTRFWPYLYEEWEQISREEDRDTRATMLDDFYETYEDQFLTEYAATSPMEDIAESWTFFVLSPKPELNSIANEKILFFYEYPELVELRTQILENICMEFPQ
jgi:hypothetical protein